MHADPFSDILKFTHAESLVTGGFKAGGRWAVRFPAPEKIKFFAVVKGACWVSMDGVAEPIRFETGDVGLLTARRSFVLGSDPEVPPLDAMSVFAGGNATLGDGNDFARHRRPCAARSDQRPPCWPMCCRRGYMCRRRHRRRLPSAGCSTI